MSNLSGNYKINAGEVQGVDVVREQERRARLQLLDEIREPSPQPIFGEPVKVELEDETSRRLKNTLGDFTEVLINDNKNLLGISRTASTTSVPGGAVSGRVPPTSKRAPSVMANGMYKPNFSSIPKHPVPEKRLGYPRNKPHDSINCPPTSFYSAPRPKDQTQWDNSYLPKPGAAPSLNGNSQSGANPSYISVNSSLNSLNLPSNKAYPFHGRNGMITNPVQASRYSEGSSSAPPPKRCNFRPSNLKLPERRNEKPVESPKRDQDLETILREMKQAVPPPLTAIQTPRTEESGFSFSDDPKEEVLLNTINELKLSTFEIKSPVNVPQPPEPPVSKEVLSRQNTPSPLLKKPDISMPSVVVDNNMDNKLEPDRNESDSYKSFKMPLMPISHAVPPPADTISPYWETERATELLESLLNESNKLLSSSLQEDLEMSDSDDEVQITDVRIAEPKTKLDVPAVQNPKPPSPVNTPVAPVISSTVVKTNMDTVPQSVPSDSSSSDSGDSDSDDSSSESNDSDSSASSDASDADTPSKMWGLSNFFDDPRRNHSPAFVPMDTSTNSSTAAVKDEPLVVPQSAKTNYSLVDDDSVNGILRDPVEPPIPNFIELDNSVGIKNEILSPITSPVHPPGPSTVLLPPPPPPPQAIRGPRTPPSPSFPVAEKSVDINRNSASSENIQTEISITAELTVPQSQTNKHGNVQQNSCDIKETGKVQAATVKKRLSKRLSEMFSPRTDSSPVTQSFDDDDDDEPSASKGLPDVSLDKDENDVVTLTSSYSVPSETSESSHENYSIKTRQKVSKSSSAKNSKTPSEETPNESGQKGNNLSKSIKPKFKHPTRTCRASTETKQLSKTVKSPAKSDKSEEVKKTTMKSDSKDKSSSEKNKSVPKTGGNLKTVPKSSVKKKPPKTPPKQVTEVKKVEAKKKKSKFHIGNFLQSPTISQSESGLLPKLSVVISPCHDKSPIPEPRNLSDSKRRPSISPSHASRSPSRSSSKSVERAKSGEKLRRSTRCSERASSLAQAESSAGANQESEVTKKNAKRTPRRRERTDSSPINVETTPLSPSPIPHVLPIPMTISECAIPTKIMVSIPFDRITRLPPPPPAIHSLDSEIKLASKRSQQPVDEKLQKKDSVLVEKLPRNAINRHAVTKDIKDKLRTDPSLKSKGNKYALVDKKDKNVKALSEPSVSAKSKTSTCVNNKTSIKAAESKQSWDASESKVSKKRKPEDSKQSQKKKLKTYPDINQDRNQHMSSRVESPSNLIASTSKSKGLERCDSVSSLSSLGSQMSQKSSKEKRSSATPDAKRAKTSRLPVKHIKQEKEDNFKTVIKKEPGTPEKSKEKSRDKSVSKDDCSEKNVLDPLWNDTSSQYSMWGDTCKEDSKGSISITAPLLDTMNRCGLDWECLDIKDLKEASNLKHNNPPIMPMDYYYREGIKQRQCAEREKDPFLQTLKYFEATVLFILTSQQREEYTKEPESVYQFYRETLNFSNLILQNVRIQHSSPGSTEFKLLILILRCQALLHVKLYNLKIKEIKEQQKSVSEFFLSHCPVTVRALTHPVPSNPRISLMTPSPHSPTPSPASSVNSQTSGYSSSDVNSCHRNLPPFSPSINVTQNMLEMICRQHTHLINLHSGHDLWEQADMYMTRSNLREFFKEVADQSENLTLHSSIKDLVNYVQTGISLVRKCSR